MEQGFSDSCIALCVGETPQNRVAMACRAAAMEMPRPTIRRWCEHGYTVAFEKTNADLKNHFGVNAPPGQAAEEAARQTEEAQQQQEQQKQEQTAEELQPIRVVNTIPISLDDVMYNLEIHENESAEDSLVLFCNKHAADDTAACIRNLLPVVLERLEESTV